MYLRIRSLLRSLFSFFGLGLVRKDELREIRSNSHDYVCIKTKAPFLQEVLSQHGIFDSIDLYSLLSNSKSEAGQDLFALVVTGFRRNLKFLEIGAYDGITFSNTYLLEKEFGWTGGLIEPLPENFSKIVQNRNGVIIQAAATALDSMRVDVWEPPASNLAHIADQESISHMSGKLHHVPGISLATILDKHLFTRELDFLSVDIEGNEIALFEHFDFSRYHFGAIVVEHNFRSNRHRLLEIFQRNNYVEVYPEYSGNDFWLVSQERRSYV